MKLPSPQQLNKTFPTQRMQQANPSRKAAPRTTPRTSHGRINTPRGNQPAEEDEATKDEEAAEEPKAEDTLDEDVAKDSAKPPDNPTIIKSLKVQTTHHSQQSNSANRTNQ